MDTKTVSEYLDRLRWAYRVLDDKTIVTGFRCLIPFYDYGVPIEIKVGQYWVDLRGFLQLRVARERRTAVAALLLSLNAQCRGVRLFMVEDCAVLHAEVAASRCHAGVFSEALKNVCRYSSAVGLEVAVLATNPSVANLFTRVEAATAPSFGPSALHDDDPLLDFDISANRLAD